MIGLEISAQNSFENLNISLTSHLSYFYFRARIQLGEKNSDVSTRQPIIASIVVIGLLKIYHFWPMLWNALVYLPHGKGLPAIPDH